MGRSYYITIKIRTIFYTTSILVSSAFTVHAQVLEKKAFKDATTIRLYVNDPTESAAISIFTDFINKTSWTVQSPPKMTEEMNVAQGVDTLRTDVGSPKVTSIKTINIKKSPGASIDRASSPAAALERKASRA